MKQSITSDELKQKYSVLWSISKLNTYNICPQQFYLSYIKQVESEDNIYSILGNVIHTAMEKIYKDNMSNNDAFIEFQKGYQDTLGKYKFPSDNIRDNWFKSMVHFMLNHNKIEGQVITERMCHYISEDNHYYL